MQQESPALSSAPLNLQLTQFSSEPGRSNSRSARRATHLREGRRKSQPSGTSRMRSVVSLSLCLLVCLALGLVCVLLACLWSSRFRGGFQWDGSELEFNWHPVLMTSGLVVMYGYASVVYRVPQTWGQSKLPWKLLHSGLMLLALLLSVLGLCAVFDAHNKKNIPCLYSLHSWVGLSAVVLFAVQLLKPLHVWLGGSILTLSIAACVSGINAKLIFVLKGNNHTEPYSRLPPEALLANSLGVVIVAFGLVVLRILTNRKWQRPDPQPLDTAYTPLNQEEIE